MRSTGDVEWLLMAYRLPREPSTPRIAAWRKLRALGAGQLGDGVAALPRTSRTAEHILWLAQEIRENGGSAAIWRAAPDQLADANELVDQMTAAVDAEYAALLRRIDEVAAADASQRSVAALRRELRLIEGRDYFAAPAGERVRRAMDVLPRATSPT